MSNPGQPAATPHDAAAALRADLAETADQAQVDDVAAEQAWARAYDLFELHIEPTVRKRCGRRTAAEIEYAFGAVRSAIQTPAQTPSRIDALQRSIDDCMLKVAAAKEP